MKTLMQFLVVSVLLCSCGTLKLAMTGNGNDSANVDGFTGSADQLAKLLEAGRQRVETNTRRYDAETNRRAVEVARELNLKALDYGWPATFTTSPNGTNGGVGFAGGMGSGMMGGSPLVVGEMMSQMGPQDPFGVNGGMYAQPNQQQVGRGNVQTTEDVKCPMEKEKKFMTAAEKDACRDEAIRVLIERK